MWIFAWKGKSGFSAKSTAEQVTEGVDGTGLTPLSQLRLERATSGLGKETARVLALRGVHVVLPVRNVDAGKLVKQTILEKIPSAKVDIMELYVSSFASVRDFASEFNSLGLPLNILINNAGIMSPPFMLSKDNIEMQFATNHLGHFLLTNLLLDNMKDSARKSEKEGRIVIVSSELHQLPYSEGIRFDKINDENSYSPLRAYGQSKLANLLHANELARRFKEERVNITANSLHPGVIATNLSRHQRFFGEVFGWVGQFVLKNVAQGAATTCYLALNPQVKGVSGEYFADSNISRMSELAKDTALAKKLWDFSLSISA